MGISGLLPLLKESINQTHISKFKGKRLAVDTYCWMHRAVYGYTEEMSAGAESTRWIQYCMGILDMLLSFDIEVYLVFDGKNLPAKEKTEADRAASRTKNLQLGHEEKRKGNTTEARSLLARSVDVSPRMAAQFIQVVRKHRPQVKYVVAPYEADAQLAYLCTHDFVDGVISEDSDCVPYGCKSILFKLDKQSGNCSHLELSSLQHHDAKGFDLRQFTADMMVTMCVAAGCDYAPSPKNFGLKSSYRLVAKLKTPIRLLKSMKFDGIMPLVVCPHASTSSSLVYEYEVAFHRAFMTFHHQTVFDPTDRRMKPLHPFTSTHSTTYPSYMHIPSEQEPGRSTLFPFLGCIVQDASVAAGIADGLVDPNSLAAFNLPECIENTNHLNRRHSDGSSWTGGAQKREASILSRHSSAIKRRRSTGGQGVFINEISASSASVPVERRRLREDGSLSASKVRPAPAKITSFFSAGGSLRESTGGQGSSNPILSSRHMQRTPSAVPTVTANGNNHVRGNSSAYFKWMTSPKIPISETLKNISSNTAKCAAERLLHSAALSPQSRGTGSDDVALSQPSSDSTLSPLGYNNSLSPPQGLVGSQNSSYKLFSLSDFAFDNNAAGHNENETEASFPHIHKRSVEVMDLAGEEDDHSSLSVEFVSVSSPSAELSFGSSSSKRSEALSRSRQ